MEVLDKKFNFDNNWNIWKFQRPDCKLLFCDSIDIVDEQCCNMCAREKKNPKLGAIP